MTLERERRYSSSGHLRSLSRGKDDTQAEFIFGYAAIFGSVYDLGWYTESIKAGAFADPLAANADVLALINHDDNLVIGRTTAGTLTLQEDDKGLRYEVLAPDTQVAKDLMISIARGDITQSSFAFTVAEDRWVYATDDIAKDHREILRIAELWDVSPVTFPANPDTTVARRSRDAWSKASPAGRPRLLDLRLRLAEMAPM